MVTFIFSEQANLVNISEKHLKNASFFSLFIFSEQPNLVNGAREVMNGGINVLQASNINGMADLKY